MKKKFIIPIIIIFILVIGVVSYFIFSGDKKVASTITLDINPSIEINLNKDNKTVSIVALNEDAKDIIKGSFKGKSLDESLNIITDNIIEKGYTKDKELVVLVYSTGKVNTGDVQERITKTFDSKMVDADVITIENVTEEDKEMARKYNITPAKANYIVSVAEEKNINVEELVTRPIDELKETKIYGNYCDEGYTLEGPSCLKEIERITASTGEVCPEGYYDYSGTCYREVPIEDTGKYYCDGEFTLEDNNCIRYIERDAIPTKYECSSGTPITRADAGLTGSDAEDAKVIVCADYSHATHPITPCELPANDPTERTSSGGRCYWHRAPVIEAGCPGKKKVNGFCWDDATNVYICAGSRDGKQYSSKSEYCIDSVKYNKATVTEYKCEEDFSLNDTKCIKKEEVQPFMERECPTGYSLVNNDRCIDYNNTKSKENGFVCERDNTRLKGNECVIYEIIEAKHN